MKEKVQRRSASVQPPTSRGGVVTRKMSKLAELNEDNAVEELTLLSDDLTLDEVIEEHEVKTAPLFTRDAFLQAGLADEHSQYGVLGRIISIQCV
ncbi:hypothetical protein BD309DRAFT_161041 [Dichomitus squalens]|nr:hypothetical protein BD309DRAFT_161041 [Dichomitus squalens]